MNFAKDKGAHLKQHDSQQGFALTGCHLTRHGIHAVHVQEKRDGKKCHFLCGVRVLAWVCQQELQSALAGVKEAC